MTDGGCRPNPGRGGWAAIIVENGLETELSGSEEQSTNNRMELTAAINGLEHVAQPSHIDLISDSRYLIDGAVRWIHAWRHRGWRTAAGKAVLNQDLWVRLATAMAKHTVRWQWVRGHAGHPLNMRADRLCQAQIDREGRAA